MFILLLSEYKGCVIISFTWNIQNYRMVIPFVCLIQWLIPSRVFLNRVSEQLQVAQISTVVSFT